MDPRCVSPRFFFHIRGGADSIEDRVGEYHFGAEAAHLRALISARELRARCAHCPSFVVIVDDDGNQLAVVPIAVAPEAAGTATQAA